MRYPFIFLAVYFLYIGNAAAYIGPGLGLGVFGALIGVVVTAFLAVVGLFWYPIKRLFKRARLEAAQNDKTDDS